MYTDFSRSLRILGVIFLDVSPYPPSLSSPFSTSILLVCLSTDVYSFLYHFQPVTRRQILNSSNLKEFPDDNFKFHENERKLSKQVENTVGKGEIARYEQFLLFPQCFQKACVPGASKGVTVWEWVDNIAAAISYILLLNFFSQ